MSEILEYNVLLQRRRRRDALAPAWRAIWSMISGARVSRIERDDVEGLEDMVVGWVDFGDKTVWMGESLLRM